MNLLTMAFICCHGALGMVRYMCIFAGILLIIYHDAEVTYCTIVRGRFKGTACGLYNEAMQSWNSCSLWAFRTYAQISINHSYHI